MVPIITRRVSSFLEKFFLLKTPISVQIKSKSFLLFFLPVSRTNLSCVIATVFSSLAFLSSSVSMANLSRLVAPSFSSLALLSSSVSKANLSCLLVTTFSSLSFISNSFSSLRFNLLRVAQRCLSWSSVSDDFSFLVVVFWFSFLLYLFRVLSSAFLSSVLQSLKLCLH